MINFHTLIKNTLAEILPTYYELSLTNDTKTPCITYMENGNSTSTYGDKNFTLQYSRITYQIKIWATSIEKIQTNINLIDAAMRNIGFQRISSTELVDNSSSMIQKIMQYEALAQEEI